MSHLSQCIHGVGVMEFCKECGTGRAMMANTLPTWRPIGRPVRAKGLTIDQMRDNFHASQEGRELYNHGDTILVWMNEGDFHMLNFNHPQALKDGK